MRLLFRLRRTAGPAVLTVLALALGACGSPAGPPAGPDPSLDGGPADRDRLAGFAAIAKDRRYVATYLLSSPGRSDRTVTAAFGTDGSWVVGIPGGALSGLADVAIYHSGASLYQCLLGRSVGTVGDRPDLGPLEPVCVPVISLASADDPRVHHVFTDWIDRFLDRATALSVAGTSLPGVAGACFSVESNSAALAPPVDPGVYCYADDGIVTYARTDFGTLLLAGTVSAAPPSVALPAPVSTTATPLPTTAPSPPVASLA